ncbi:phenylalanine--tRNA ligase subunit beta [Candidatus Thiothrix sp. Deng01]|uniref:Phenylalanine--tRNA ligase beta subunit n=1 Tax=Candidatus Thiothrix phosphatis TaxID=3112415 RepID=A0ABU6CZJ0_9GAMM|nr:phenylalanine--tRNA ligase subunit beta [Candidatus Thiothrix sp. Deng01]MEB4592256.1 phenylalanine--tRNA ligase subunit beta [Candidatus Thiothrix sp. Deng01]
MKVSEKWLREWVGAPHTLDEIADKLTMSGCEVEAREPVAAAFTGIVVGHVVEREKHPDADKLSVCKVDNGQGEILQIVCGASNVRAGLKAPLALLGAVLPLPDGKELKIKKGKLRGVESFGMLCSAVELGIADKSDGLLELPEDAPVGVNIREYLQLDDEVIELAITANRGDCMSMIGVARETALVLDAPLKTPEIAPVTVRCEDTFPVDVQAADACPRYAGRIIRNIDPQAPTPIWMQEKLRRAGIRSISATVDVTNYVLLELGQPMHAFDLDKLQNGIVVRYAKDGEMLAMLDGRTATLRRDTLVIADGSRPVAMAGVMGGEPTSVTDATRNVFLESAHFRPAVIMGKARSYGLQTDSAARFERGVDPDMALKAMERATRLIVDICGGDAGPVVDLCADSSVLERKSILLRPERIRRVLGVSMDDAIVEGVLARLNCEFSRMESGWWVKAPLARFDLAIEEDLIEELARVRGYDSIPAELRPRAPRIIQPSEKSVGQGRLRNLLVARGYQEAVTFSFVDPKMELMLAPTADNIVLANPISADLGVMRSTLWSGLLRSVVYNLNRQQQRVRLFEVGPAFFKDTAGNPQQQTRLAGVITGNLYPEQWGQVNRPVDFYDLKGDVEALLEQAAGVQFHFAPVAHAALHPGQSAEIMTQTDVVGWMGMLHPRIEEKLGLEQPVYLFELDMRLLAQRILPKYQAISRFPAIRRDLALLVREDVLAVALENAVRKAAVPQLVSYYLFDVYSGKGIPEGRKSVALSLILQDFSRTLEDAEINRIVEGVVASLQEEVGATLR